MLWVEPKCALQLVTSLQAKCVFVRVRLFQKDSQAGKPHQADRRRALESLSGISSASFDAISASVNARAVSTPALGLITKFVPRHVECELRTESYDPAVDRALSLSLQSYPVHRNSPGHLTFASSGTSNMRRYADHGALMDLSSSIALLAVLTASTFGARSRERKDCFIQSGNCPLQIDRFRPDVSLQLDALAAVQTRTERLRLHA